MKLAGLNHKNFYNPNLSIQNMNVDTSQLKEKIMQIIQRRGPSLPVHISNETGQSMLFSSAFLSELLSEKKIKISNLRVGSSPLYFIPGQEPKLENYSQHLKSKEKEAFHLLKEKKFLKDSNQEPAIRVALRTIKDFAIPFKKNEEIYWRFFTIPEEEFQKIEEIKEKTTEIKIEQEIKKEAQEKEEKPKELDIFEKREKPEINILEQKAIKEKIEIKKIKKPIIKKKKTSASQKKNEKFFNTIKEYLSSKNIEISDIIGFSKNDLTLKIISNNQEKLLIAYNKKKITEKDLLNAYKKASETNLPYTIFSLGETPKKISNMIDAIKNLDSVEKID